MSSTINRLLDKAVAGQRLNPGEGLRLLESNDLASLGRAADAVTRRLHPEPSRTYNVDRNVNYTNVCTSGCRFCAFSHPPGHADGYVIDRHELYGKIEETIRLGGDQILLQGGMHPELDLPWCEQLLRDIKQRFPQINIHGFSPPEIYHFTKVNKLSLREVLERLRAAGLGSGDFDRRRFGEKAIARCQDSPEAKHGPTGGQLVKMSVSGIHVISPLSHPIPPAHGYACCQRPLDRPR